MVVDIIESYGIYIKALAEYKKWYDGKVKGYSHLGKDATNAFCWGREDWADCQQRNYTLRGMELVLGLTESEIKYASVSVGINV